MIWLVIFIYLEGPGGQRFEINPEEVVILREPKSSDHFPPGTHCIVNTTDGKYATVTDTCEEVSKKLKER